MPLLLFNWGLPRLPREIPKDSEAYFTGVAPADGTGVKCLPASGGFTDVKRLCRFNWGLPRAVQSLLYWGGFITFIPPASGL